MTLCKKLTEKGINGFSAYGKMFHLLAVTALGGQGALRVLLLQTHMHSHMASRVGAAGTETMCSLSVALFSECTGTLAQVCTGFLLQRQSGVHPRETWVNAWNTKKNKPHNY